MNGKWLHPVYFLALFSTASCGQLQVQSPRYQSPYENGHWNSPSMGKLKSSEFQRPHQRSSTTGTPTPSSNSDFSLQWPVKRVKITQGFRPQHNHSHEGIDLIHYYGAPIYASHYGHVVYTGSQFRGYGRMVIVEYNEKWATLYGHLEEILVEEGDTVGVGQKIGTMGNTGRTTGTHLHFELLRNKIPVNPLLYLQSRSFAKK